MLYPILAAGFFVKFLAVIWFIVAIALIFVVLIQKAKGGGLSGALSGGMASNILGADTKKPMTWFTIGLVCVFLFLAVILVKFLKPPPIEEETIPGAGQGQPIEQVQQPVTVPETQEEGQPGELDDLDSIIVDINSM